MGNLLNIVTPLHKRTNRDFLSRMINDKVSCMKTAKQYGFDYWDGDRKFGYGGYKYDGRWKVVTEKLAEHYSLPSDAKILDIGCGKGFLLHEFHQVLPGSQVTGFDISRYAINNCKPEVQEHLFVHDAQKTYPFSDKGFDLAVSLTTLHNLLINGLKTALGEIERVAKNKYIVVESYKDEQELFNLQCWALTCNSFFSPGEWKWLFDEFGYTGDYEFIYF